MVNDGLSLVHQINAESIEDGGKIRKARIRDRDAIDSHEMDELMTIA